MVKILGVEFAPLNVPLSRRLQTAVVVHWVCTFLFLGFGSLFVLIYLLFTGWWWVPCLYATWLAYDHSICYQGGRRMQSIRKWRMWKYYRDYFPISLVKTVELDPQRNYVFGFHPHGVLSCGSFCNFATEATDFRDLFPGIKPYLLTLTGLFHLPLFREYLLFAGACDSSKESLHHILTNEGSGNAAVLVVGGAKEALDANPNSHVVLLKKRKGFIKIAMKYGASLVPIYSFGETNVYSQVPNPKGSKVRWAQDKLVSILGFSSPLFRGRGVFNYTFGILPYRTPITTVVGAPIHIAACGDDVHEDDVTRIHNKYIDALCKLFDDHKGKFGIDDSAKLQVM